MIPESYTALGVDPQDRKPVFAVLRIGSKDPERGHPIDKTNFNVVDPIAMQREFKGRKGSYKAPSRPLSAEFTDYNSRKRRNTFHGILPYSQLTDCWEVRRRAATLEGWPQHPDTFLTCESRDGATAERLYKIGDETARKDPPEDVKWVEGRPEDESWAKIPCPGSLCEFAQSGECKTRAWLYFISNEPDMPRVLMRYQTGGQATTIQNIGAFFEDLDRMASALGVRIDNLAGIPFVLNLSMAVSRKNQRQMPIVTMALDGTVPQVLAERRADAQMGGGQIEVQLLPSTTETDSEPAKSLDIIDAEPVKPGQSGLFEDSPDADS